jgi:hypothetical protein
MAERGFTVEGAKDVVKYYQQRQWQYHGEHGGDVFRFSKRRGSARLVVVAEIKANGVGW